MTVRKSGINLTFCLHALVLSETETVTHAYIASTRDFKQIATAMVDTESWGEYVAVVRQISTLSKRHPNSDYGVSRSFAFAAGKTQGRRNYWKTRNVKYFLDNVKNNL